MKAKGRRLTRRALFKGPAGLMLASKAGALETLLPADVRSPNVIMILADDMGWWDLRMNGNPHVETPNIDRLASQGVALTHFYASPVCTPTRAALLTGRHYQRTGALDSILDREPLNPSEITLAQVFQKRGYETALIGKWHLGRYMKYHPNNFGFKEFFGFWQYGQINRYFDSDELFHNKQPVSTAKGYITDILTDQAIRVLNENASRPFFLYVAYNAPHVPHQVPDRFVEKYLKKNVPLDPAKIYGMIDSLDENVGRLLASVEALGISERTIVLFMSDNGGINRHFRGGMRGGKGSVYEGGVRVPFVARWPKRLPAGAVLNCEAQHIDVFPTLCELTGIKPHSERRLDGKSIAAHLARGKGASPHRYLFHQWHRVYGPRKGPDKWAVLDVERGYKLVTPHSDDLQRDPDKPEQVAAGGGPVCELFDLRRDPGEKIDLAKRFPDVAAELQKVHDEWYADVTAGRAQSRLPIEVGRSDENPVEITLLWGEPVGKKLQLTFFHYVGDTFDHWSEVADYARWNIDVVQAGNYQVTMEYSCLPEDAGSKVAISVGDSKLEHTVEATAGKDVLASRRVGTMSLTKGPAVLEVRPISIAGKELMALHSLWLERV